MVSNFDIYKEKYPEGCEKIIFKNLPGYNGFQKGTIKTRKKPTISLWMGQNHKIGNNFANMSTRGLQIGQTWKQIETNIL